MKKYPRIFKEKIGAFLKDPFYLTRWVSPYDTYGDSNRITSRVGSGYRWIDYSGDVFMFTQDMYQGIMPLTHEGQRSSQLKVELDVEDINLEKIIIAALESDRHTLEDALSNFIRNATQTLFSFGKAAYEITYKKDGRDKVTEFSLEYVHPLSVFKFFGNYYQVIPWRTARHDHVRAGIYRIPKAKLLYIEFPKRLGGRSNIKKILKRLAYFSREVFPNFQLKAMEKNIGDTGFNFESYRADQYIEKAALTRNLGWNQRQFSDDRILEYYSLYRHLKFILSQAIVREHILSCLNSALNGSLLHLGAQIKMSGIPTSKEFQKEFEKLAAGNLAFIELYEKKI